MAASLETGQLVRISQGNWEALSFAISPGYLRLWALILESPCSAPMLIAMCNSLLLGFRLVPLQEVHFHFPHRREKGRVARVVLASDDLFYHKSKAAFVLICGVRVPIARVS